MMLVCVSIGGVCHTIPPWTILVVEDSCTLLDQYTGIHNGYFEVPFASACPLDFPASYKEQPFFVEVGTKKAGPFMFAVYLRGLVRSPLLTLTSDTSWSNQRALQGSGCLFIPSIKHSWKPR